MKITFSSGVNRKAGETNDGCVCSLLFAFGVLLDGNLLKSLIEGNQKEKEKVIPSQDVAGDF